MPNGKRELSFAPSKRPCKLSFWVSERVKHSLLSEARRIFRFPPPPPAPIPGNKYHTSFVPPNYSRAS